MSQAFPIWRSLKETAEQSALAALHDQAITLYTAALGEPDIPWPAVREMRLARAISGSMLGDFDAFEHDLDELVAAEVLAGDDVAVASVLVEFVLRLRIKGNMPRCLELARTAVLAATRTGQNELRVAALAVRGIIQVDMGKLKHAAASLAAAESLPLAENQHGRVIALILRGYLALRKGELDQVVRCTESAHRLARVHIWPIWEAYCLNLLAIAEPDMARRGVLLEELLASWTRLGDQPNQVVALFNLSVWYTEFGMFNRSIDVAERALTMAHSMHMDIPCIYILQVLAAAYSARGDPSTALSYALQGTALAKSEGIATIEHLFRIMLAQIFLSVGDTQRAIAEVHAAEHALTDEPRLYTANRLSTWALAARMAGDRSTAQQMSTEAIGLFTRADYGNPEMSIDEYCWWCYLALFPDQHSADVRPPTNFQWQILDTAVQAVLTPINTLSDAGLRRSYLHRPWHRRLTILEWLKWAPQHASPSTIAAVTEQLYRPGHLNDIFRRLLAVGVRLDAQRDPTVLAAQIVDEVAELTGAERIALVLMDETGLRRAVKVSLPILTPIAFGGSGAPKPDPELFLQEIEPFLGEVTTHQRGFVRQLAPERPISEQRSVLMVPLISRGHLVGAVYCDLSVCFGRFELEDLDLLGVLANQSAVAIENSEWAALLEHKVALRKAELAELVGELHAANVDLEQRVAARTSELTTALAELRRAVQLKDEFMAAITHELRTPLTGILGMAENTAVWLPRPTNGAPD